MLGAAFFVLSLASAPASAEKPEQETAERPKIGLALGGGSARGIAHVGVLEWLEEHQIPVDFVAGTSMGGLVGGAYATGLSPKEVRTLLRNVDWDLLFIGEAPYPVKELRRKEDRRDYPVDLELGLRHGVQLPSGLDPAHQVGLLLSRIGLAYSTLDNFDELPTPFRSVATDLASADVMVLEDGPLSEALLATMAIPGVFPAVERNGSLLADGGLLNNVPADVVRAMGADIVIAVDVATGEHKTPSKEALSAMSQAIDVMMAYNTDRTLRDAKVVLTPDVSDVGALDWRDSDAIADLGREAAQAKTEKLEPFRLEDEAWQRHLDERASRSRPSVFVPDFVHVEGGENSWNERITGELESFVGSPLDVNALENALTKITGTERFESLRYEGALRDGQHGLDIVVTPKTYGPPFLRFFAGVGNDAGELNFDFAARLTALDVSKKGAEVRADVSVGSLLGARIEYFLPLRTPHIFVAPRASYLRRIRNVVDGGDIVARLRDRIAAIGFDVGVRAFRKAEIRLGYQIGDVESKLRVGAPLFPESDGTEELMRLRFEFEGVDEPVIPTRGLRAFAEVNWFTNSTLR